MRDLVGRDHAQAMRLAPEAHAALAGGGDERQAVRPGNRPGTTRDGGDECAVVCKCQTWNKKRERSLEFKPRAASRRCSARHPPRHGELFRIAETPARLAGKVRRSRPAGACPSWPATWRASGASNLARPVHEIRQRGEGSAAHHVERAVSVSRVDAMQVPEAQRGRPLTPNAAFWPRCPRSSRPDRDSRWRTPRPQQAAAAVPTSSRRRSAPPCCAKWSVAPRQPGCRAGKYVSVIRTAVRL